MPPIKVTTQRVGASVIHSQQHTAADRRTFEMETSMVSRDRLSDVKEIVLLPRMRLQEGRVSDHVSGEGKRWQECLQSRCEGGQLSWVGGGVG